MVGRSLRLGIDGTALCAPLTGIGWYVRQVLFEFRRIAPDMQVLVYVSRPLVVKLEPGLAELRHERYPFPLPGLIWRQYLLPRLAQADRIDCFWGPAQILPVRLPRRIPTVMTVHDLVNIRYPETMEFRTRLTMRLHFCSSLRRADAVISVSASTRDELHTMLGYPESRVTVIRQGVEPMFRPMPAETVNLRLSELGLKPGYLLAVGTIEPRKNHQLLLEALARLPDLPMLVLAGRKGWGCEHIYQMVAERHLEARVRFLDYVASDDLPVLLNGAQLLVLPSFYEGFGLPILQAMACGTPILASAIPSLQEVGGDVPVYFDVRSPDALCTQLTRVLADSALRQQMSAKGRERARLFTWERTARRTLAVIENVVRSPR